MKNILITILFLIIVLLLTSCKEGVMEPYVSEQLFGTWVYQGPENDVTIMKKADGLDPNNYGFVLYAGGKFLERKNSGWCGTPPISYENYDGKWKAETENVLQIDVGYWRGKINYKMEIITLSSTELRFKQN
jgi:hypothetical protein